MWLPLFDKVGKEQNWNIQGYAKSACSPVPLSRAKPDAAGADREAAEGCTEFVMETAKELAEDPDIDIIATASLANTESFYLEDETQASDAAIVESIGSMWESWNEAGKTVVAMGEVPHFSDVEAPTCIAENSSDIAAKCTGSYEEEYDSLRKLITTTAKNNSSDAHLYDPVPALCEQDRCYSMVGNLITRYDNHHLSEEFVESYGDDFVDFMRQNVLS